MRTQSRAFLSDDGMPQPIEFFVASDAAAIVEHTKRVLYLEDDDIAHIAEGEFHIHRLRKNDGVSAVRAIETLEIELAAIMKGPSAMPETRLTARQLRSLHAEGDLRAARVGR